MPACSDCHMLVGGECSAYRIAMETGCKGRKGQPPPVGACMLPIVDGYLSFIKRNMRVLEIGCGAWGRIADHCRQVGAEYEGIDVLTEYMGKQTVATRIENLHELSFGDEYFDLVIGNQTMEHWAEYGCTLRWGLYQCFRVCKQQGRVLLNVHIHFHGTRTFMLGELDRLQRLFAPFSGRVELSKWGSPSDPLPPLFPYAGFWSLRNKPAYVLDIQAIKDRPLPKGYSNRGAARGRWAQLLNYPLSYNIYRVLRKARVVGRARNGQRNRC